MPTITAIRPGLVLALLLGGLTASAQDLRDAGYGDGSLVDTDGQYYYPQPDGSYLDVYGATFRPLGDGLYSDPLGNLLDAGPDGDDTAPDNSAPLDQRTANRGLNNPRNPWASSDPLPTVRDQRTGDDWLANDGAAARVPIGTTRRGQTGSTGGTGAFGSMYLDDVGDGYLELDPEAVAADPRLAEPERPSTQGRPGSSSTGQTQTLGARSNRSAPGTIDDDLSTMDAAWRKRRLDDSAPFKGANDR